MQVQHAGAAKNLLPLSNNEIFEQFSVKRDARRRLDARRPVVRMVYAANYAPSESPNWETGAHRERAA